MPRHEIDVDAALERFMTLTAIPAASGNEQPVAAAIVAALLDAGLPADSIAFDDAHLRTRIRGNCGNLIVHLPGRSEGPRTLLSAHMDTVPICLGSVPVRDGDTIRSSAATGLGADDRSGCAAILTAAVERLRSGRNDLPAAVLAFFIQEEVGLEGARHLDQGLVGHIDRGFNFDGGPIEKLTNGAIGGQRIMIRILGTPAHAGVAPEQGASAITMASIAIADLHRRGWLGRVIQPEGRGTANVGIIQGGDATNVVTPEVTLKAEARSHDATMRQLIVDQIQAAFAAAVAQVTTHQGIGGKLEFESRIDYEAFKLPEDHPSIEAARRAVVRVGRTPYVEVAGGGLDANWLYVHGIQCVTMGCGQRSIHTAQEWLDVNDYLDACRVAKSLVMDDHSVAT